MQEQISADCPSVVIGPQEWMGSNLQATHYRNGDLIRQVNDIHEWRNSTTGSMCWYEGESQHGQVFGCLYNWYAVNDPRGLAPEGWRVPEDKDWQDLVDFLGGSDLAGGALKHSSSNHWKRPNAGASNSSGFSAMPGGFRSLYGDFDHLGYYGYYWSSTPYYGKNCAWIRVLGYFDSKVIHTGGAVECGYSVRCIKC